MQYIFAAHSFTMTEFAITTESLLPRYSYRIKSQGRKPSSIEYEIGTKIYNDFNVGNCSFFPSTTKYKSILSRLDRLNKKNDTDREYVVRKCTENGEIIGGIRSVVDGFKVFRTK